MATPDLSLMNFILSSTHAAVPPGTPTMSKELQKNCSSDAGSAIGWSGASVKQAAMHALGNVPNPSVL